MRPIDYGFDELRFAYGYHAFLHWGSYRRRRSPALATLDQRTLQTLVNRFGVRVRECHSQPTEVRVLISLQPQEPMSACAGKFKSQTSKWLRQAASPEPPTARLARGYFACTSGQSTAVQVETYLNDQGDHHGYGQRAVPPTYVQSYTLDPETEARLQPDHAYAVLQFHLVLATWRRHGVFGREEGEAIAASWKKMEIEGCFALRKVSFVPDHVHVAARTHPGVAPAQLVLDLMTGAQQIVWERFPGAAIRARVERLWQPSAYVGSYGGLATPQIRQYIRNWRQRQEKEE
jgi:REP element-mobilizing transposase RayT